jgi:hypothetical protein
VAEVEDKVEIAKLETEDSVEKLRIEAVLLVEVLAEEPEPGVSVLDCALDESKVPL